MKALKEWAQGLTWKWEGRDSDPAPLPSPGLMDEQLDDGAAAQEAVGGVYELELYEWNKKDIARELVYAPCLLFGNVSWLNRF